MKRKVIGGLLVSSALSSGGINLAHAQEQVPASAEAVSDNAVPAQRIVVTGIRRALESARNQKRNAVQFVDAIVADDIGKLPDKNVAESLSRVSGIQVDRGVGEGTNVSIRGLRQNVLLYNGREILDATGRGGTGIDQAGTTTYGIMALVPSGLISNLEVTKLAGAEQIAGGLGGVVDIRSRMPLEGPEQIAGKVGMSYDQLPAKRSYDVFGLITRKFDNNKVGILASVFYDTHNLSQQGLDTFAGYRAFSDPAVPGSPKRFGNQDVRASDIQERRNKVGVNAVVQWRPHADLELTADTFLSRLDSERDRVWIGFNPTSGLTNPSYSPNNILISGRATVPVLTNTEYANIESQIGSSALRAKFALSNTLKGTAEISTGKSTTGYHQLYMRIQPLASITTSVDFDLSKGAFGDVNINGIDLSDVNSLRQTILFDSHYNAKTTNNALRADLRKRLDSSWAESIEFGARHQKLDSTQTPTIADIRPAGGVPLTQLGSFLTTYSNPDFASGSFNGLPRSYLVPSRAAFTGCSAFSSVAAISNAAPCVNAAAQVSSLAATFQIKEEFTDAYTKLNMSGEIAGAEVDGNVGVRMVRRDLISNGNLINSTGGATPVSVTRSDREVLPSAVAKITLNPETVVRLGAAKVVAFPNTADLNNGVRLFAPVITNGVVTVPGTGNGGSPQLNAFKATQLDLSFEHYFGKQAMASLGLFNKDVSSFIIQRQTSERFDGVDYLINRKVNGEGASVRGVEASLQLPFYFLPSPASGFGLMATYSYIESKTPIRDVTGNQLTFPGLSKNNANLVAYYEEGPISARFAVNWRNKYLVGISAAATGIYNDSYTDVSATMRYDLTKSVSLNLEANNITDSKQRTYDGSPEALRTNAIYGRIFKASISAKF